MAYFLFLKLNHENQKIPYAVFFKNFYNITTNYFNCLQPTTKVKKDPYHYPCKDSIGQAKERAANLAKEEQEEEKPFVLTEENAIPFFFEYQKTHKQSKVKVYTSMGDFVIDLYDNTPYHRANMIYLSSKKYFNNTFFHRVVKDFIIQGGNTDLKMTA